MPRLHAHAHARSLTRHPSNTYIYTHPSRSVYIPQPPGRFLLALVVEHFLMAAKVVLSAAIHDVPPEIRAAVRVLLFLFMTFLDACLSASVGARWRNERTGRTRTHIHPYIYTHTQTTP